MRQLLENRQLLESAVETALYTAILLLGVVGTIALCVPAVRAMVTG